MDIKAIETEYKGYRFRSRLEARWAVFFDAMNIKYEYEPEGYEANYDGAIYRYLPDFYLHDFDKYVEVKGSTEQLREDFTKIIACVDYNKTPVSKGLILLSEIPDPTRNNETPSFPMLFCNKGVRCEYVTFWCDLVLERDIEKIPKLLLGSNEIIQETFTIYPKDTSHFTDTINDNPIEVYADYKLPDNAKLEINWITTDSVFKDDYFMGKIVNKAYLMARQARFEHGEKGA